MAARDARIKHPAIPSLFAAIILASLLLLLSALRSSTVPPSHPAVPQSHSRCNYSAGAWVRDPSPLTPRYDSTCKEIFKGWNCIAAGKPNALDLLRWRWRPSACHLPQLDPLRFLHRYRNTNIGFVDDSLNRNVFVLLVCLLRRVSGEMRKWRPAGADRGFTFLRYNLTVAYRTKLLVRYGWWSASEAGGALESLGFREAYRVDVDLPEHTWAEAPMFYHILVVNTGHCCSNVSAAVYLVIWAEAVISHHFVTRMML